MIYLQGDSLTKEVKIAWDSINVDLDLKATNPIRHEKEIGLPKTIIHFTKNNFRKVYDELTLDYATHTIIDNSTNKPYKKLKGIVILRDGHICPLLDDVVYLFSPLYYNSSTNCIHVCRDIIASEVPFEQGDGSLSFALEGYNERVRKLLGPTEQASKQIAVVVLYDEEGGKIND